MKKSASNLMYCAMVFAVALVISNVVTAKTIDTHIPFLGATLQFPGAVLCYAITFLMTDVVGELWGPREARRVVAGGFACQVLACVLIVLTQLLPASDAAMQSAYETLLGQNAVFVVASLTGYVCSQSWDVFIFHRLRARVLAARPQATNLRWLWNNASTMTSQAIDTVLFIGIAFGLGSGWLLDAAMLPTLAGMMAGQYLVKLVLAALDTPVFYLLTRGAAARAAQEGELAARA